MLRRRARGSFVLACFAAACGPLGTAPAGGMDGGTAGGADGPASIVDSGGHDAAVVTTVSTPRPEFAGPCARAAAAIDVNVGNAPEAFVRAAYCQVTGNEPPPGVVETWSASLRAVPYVRRIDVVRTFCQEAGRSCALAYSDPWATDVATDARCQRKTTRDLGAVFMFFSDCPGRVNCAMDWANTHALGMASPHTRFAFGATNADYYNPKNAGFWYRELLDARWAGLQFLLLNVYGPDLAKTPDPLALLSSALGSAGTDVKIALFDDPWAWGKPSSPAPWQTAPNLTDTEGAAQTLYQAKWKPFYARVARDAWYMVENRPFIYFYNAGTLAPLNVSAAVVGRMKELFQQDFGVVPFVAADGAYFQDAAMNDAADARFTWDTLRAGRKSRTAMKGITLDHFMVKWDALGRDSPGAIATSSDRILKGTALLDQMLASSNDAQIAVVATWNDLGEGTGIARNYDYYADGAWLPSTAFMGRTRAAQCADDPPPRE
ncbi:MAG TPA: DUF5010 domain-containing protein [Polyangiaceae bacterium]|nr:DUF5010 domain-containing protein [Polyangiaceae bacterium]